MREARIAQISIFENYSEHDIGQQLKLLVSSYFFAIVPARFSPDEHTRENHERYNSATATRY